MNAPERISPPTLFQQARAAGHKLREAREDARFVLSSVRVWQPVGRAIVRCVGCKRINLWRYGVAPDAADLPHGPGCPIGNLLEMVDADKAA